VVETILNDVGLLGDIFLLFSVSDGSSFLGQTLLLLNLGLRAILVEEAEGLGSKILVEDILELGDRWGDLQAKVEDLLLALQANILGPFNHAGKVAPGLDVLPNAIVAGALLDKRVLGLLGNSSATLAERGGRDFFSF